MNAATPLALLAAPAWRDDGFVRALGAAYAVEQAPQPLPDPHWVARNHDLAEALGWSDWLHGDDALAMLAGNAQPQGGTLATAYSGHQFGVWAGQLGDGRALLLGEADTPQGRIEVQLKGSGLTPFSRMGDGRAVLRSSIREYLCSEAMHALGIPTTRALALVGSALPVRRETVETAAVVTRLAPSFLRFGHFEHFTHTASDDRRAAPAGRRRDRALLPRAAVARRRRPAYAALLQEVALRTATLMAQWQAVGFCHGVMNTDNMSILGLTLDYGPFGFLDAFDPGHICNHTDHERPLRLGAPAAGGVLEPARAGAGADAADRRQRRRRWPRSSPTRPPLPTRCSAPGAPSSGCAQRATRTAPWPTTCCA